MIFKGTITSVTNYSNNRTELSLFALLQPYSHSDSFSAVQGTHIQFPTLSSLQYPHKLFCFSQDTQLNTIGYKTITWTSETQNGHNIFLRTHFAFQGCPRSTNIYRLTREKVLHAFARL